MSGRRWSGGLVSAHAVYHRDKLPSDLLAGQLASRSNACLGIWLGTDGPGASGARNAALVTAPVALDPGYLVVITTESGIRVGPEMVLPENRYSVVPGLARATWHTTIVAGMLLAACQRFQFTTTAFVVPGTLVRPTSLAYRRSAVTPSMWYASFLLALLRMKPVHMRATSRRIPDRLRCMSVGTAGQVSDLGELQA